MKIKYLYILFAIIGLVLPYTHMIPYISENGMDMVSLFKSQFANDATSFFGFDLLIAAIIILIFMYIEAKRMKMKHVWLPFLSVICIGLAFGLPLFLYMRENHLEKMFFNKHKN